jgi:phosphoglycerol transferase MdoB-like AlkP superfamily enzyme
MFPDRELRRLGSWKVRISAVILIPPLLFIIIRGGWQEIIINTSSAYYSSNRMNNLIAVNSGWSFMEAMNAALSSRGNPYHFFPMDQARSESKKLFRDGKHRSFLKSAKPNIVLLILESWTADAVPSLGGEIGIAPNFEKLIPEGMLFTEFYSSGVRSNQGLISVLSSFPGMSSAFHNPNQMQRLPCLARDLKKAGYSSSFLHGGDLNFSNFRAYIRFCGFDKLISIEDFPSEQTAGKWGAHDEYVLDRQIEVLRNAPEPFFSTLFTLSSHEPFKVPGETPYKGKSLADKFRGALHYSDESLGRYFEKVRHEPWFKNTIFILVADHGHRLPLLRLEYSPQRYHIPLLIFGEPLKNNLRGTKVSRIGSQIDITATLLSELGLPSRQYTWGKDLMSEPPVSFAYYSFDDGFGLIETGRTTVYDKRSGRWAITKNGQPSKMSAGNETNETLKQGQAMMQSIYQDYLELH